MLAIDLTGKTALVCGASAGIGRAVAMAFADAGASVIALARRQPALDEVIDSLPVQSGQKHGSRALDLSDLSQVESAAEQLAQENIVIWLNNSGGPPGGPANQASPQAFRDAFAQHLLASQILARQLIPGMQRVGYGRIINVISTSVKQPIKGLGVSNTVRGAVANWAKTLATELGPDGITVNNLLPGATATGRLDQIFANRAKKSGRSEAEESQAMQESIPARRFAQPRELGYAAAFLASPLSAYINGINLPVDGGRTGCL